MALREFSSVKVGDQLPEKIYPLTRQDLVNYAGVSGDLNPIHWDDEIAKIVGRLTLFQRSPNWIVPRMNRPYTEQEKAGFRAQPAAMQKVRDEIFRMAEDRLAAKRAGLVADDPPIPLAHLDGLDSLLSIVQMPAGVPVATVGVGAARNAGLLAVRILASGTDPLARRLAPEYATFQDGLRAQADLKGERLRARTSGEGTPTGFSA